MDDNLILIPNSLDLTKIYLATADAPIGFVKCRKPIQNLYEGCTFEYLILPIDPASKTTPVSLVSSVPPHLTISSTVDKILKRWGYKASTFRSLRSAFVDLVKKSSAISATFTLRVNDFTRLRYVHERWATLYVPPSFLGLEPDEDEDAEEDETIESEAGSSTMEWEVGTAGDEEPQRRLLPHEMEAEPIYVTKFLAANRSRDEDDELISHDSHISGVDDPDEFAKASKALGDYEKDASWSKGIQSWTTDVLRVDDDQMVLNDTQIEEDPQEKPRVAASLDFDDPDFVSTAARQGHHNHIIHCIFASHNLCPFSFGASAPQPSPELAALLDSSIAKTRFDNDT
ncbi:hypothetical protein C8R47DRAFT_175206 [Mycena vitilis]|nr:hypothetical protein C8R47DRAFT_175206 [Mycena vitilis]